MFSDTLSRINLWGWNAIIVAAAVSLALGKTTSKEYAELEWPIDIAIAVVWVCYAVNFFGTLARRKEKAMYVAIWFWIATIITIAAPAHLQQSRDSRVVDEVVLHLRRTPRREHPVVVRAQRRRFPADDADPRADVLLPAQDRSNRPIYSHRLSIVHFWSLVFIYMWADPHHPTIRRCPTGPRRSARASR